MAEEQSQFRREFHADMAEIKETAKQHNETARIQAESVRELVRLLNQRQA